MDRISNNNNNRNNSASKICHACGKQGHLGRNCPTKLTSSTRDKEFKDCSCKLTEEERASLSAHPHTFDYPLTEEQQQFLDDNGYLVLKGIVEKEMCEQVIKEAFARAKITMGVDKQVEESWPNLPRHGCVDIWHLPSLYELRQHPKLYSVFAQVLKTHKLVPSIDRVGMKSPCRKEGATNEGLQLHTDLNYWNSTPDKPAYQGGLCLQDCPVGGGGFWCIPGFHKADVIKQYMIDYEDGKFGNHPVPGPGKSFIIFQDLDYARQHVREIPLEQGDFVIWNNNLPHNGGVNTLPDRWRLHAYVRFLAMDGPTTDEKSRRWAQQYHEIVSKSMQTWMRPTNYATENSVKTPTPANGEVAFRPRNLTDNLTDLGQQLFRLKSWTAGSNNVNNSNTVNSNNNNSSGKEESGSNNSNNNNNNNSNRGNNGSPNGNNRTQKSRIQGRGW